MSRINIYHGVLSGDRIEREIEGGITIRDALDGVDLSNSIMLVNGSPCDGNRVLLPGDICDIRILPEGGEGADGWNLIDTIMTVFTGGIWGIGSAITGAACGKTWGKLLWDQQFEDPDTSTKSQEQVQQLPYISGAENRSLQGNPVPFIMGRHLLSPYYCGTPYTQISGDDGEDQYMYMLFMLGYSQLKVTDIKIGDQMLARNGGNVINGRIPMDNNDMVMYNAEIELDQSGSDLSLYRQTVYEEQVQIELLNTNKDRVFKNEPKRFSGRNPMRVEVELYIPSLLAYDDKGNKKNASVSVSIMYRWSTLDGSTEWKPFAKVEGSNSYSNGTSTITRSKARNMRFVATRSFSYNDIPRLDGELYPSAKVEIKVARESENPTDNKVQSQLYLVALRTWSYDYDKSKAARTLVPEKPVSEELMAQTARLAIKIKSSEDLSGQIKQVNCVLQSYARVWDGNEWSTDEVPTSNPASICLKALQSNMLGNNRKSDSEIDLDTLGRLYEHCEDTYSRDVAEINAINKRGCKLECNGVVTTTMPLRDLLVRILASGRAVMTSQGLKFSVLFDGARSQFVTILNNQNVLSATNTKDFEKVVDGYKVKFIDQTDNWQENIMFVNFDDGTTVVKPNYEYEQIEMTYCTHRDQVWHNAMFEGAKRMYRKEQWKRTLSVDGAMLSLFDLVQVQDDTLVVGIGDGAEITSLEYDETGNYITAIQTDGHFNVHDTDKAYGLKIVQADGVNEPSIRVCRVEIPYSDLYSSFKLTNPIYIKERVVPLKGDIVAFGEYGKETTNAFVVDKQAKGDGTYDITLMPYSDDVYKYEKNRVMPVFDSKINPPQPFAGIPESPQDYLSREELYSSINVITLGSASDIPDTPSGITAFATMDGIDIAWNALGTSMRNVVKYYIVSLSRGGAFESVATPGETSYKYSFDRRTDGYPEASDLANWRVRVRAVNLYDKVSPWSDEVPVSTTQYLTWLAPPIEVTSALANAEGIAIQWRCLPELTYGDMRYGYTILYEDKEIATKKGIIAYTDTYNFDRDTDGYPEKAGVIASLQAMGIDPKGRDLDKYSVEVFAYTLQKEDQKTTDTADVLGIYYGTWVPASVQQVKAIAYQDRIEVEASAPSTPNNYGTPYRFIFERKKGASDWERFEIDGPSITFNFDRQVDGYPEVDELATWRFRAKAVSTAGKENINWGGDSDGVAINLDHYGTWRVGNPQVNASTADRTIRLVMSQPPRADNRQPYGTIQYKIQINRPLTDPLNTWFKPSLSLNPYTSEGNYKDGDGYYVASSVYLQTMPLLGQGSEQIENTVYMFRVAAFNEASESDWVEVVATAEASSIKDIVKAKETVKEAYISDLSALSANLGNISQGSLSGNDNNKWDLSTFVDDFGRNHYEGEFRVGGGEQYLHVQPILDSNNMPTGEYRIDFKAGVFELTATANRINGELVVMTNAQALDRTRITPTGTYFEHRETSASDNWTVISQLRTDGLSTESVYSTQSLVITNHDLQTRRKKKIDIGRPYLSDSSRVWHFDTDLLDQYQGEGLEVLGNVDLVDQYNSTDKSLDFTPAILAVAPYAEIGRSAYGQFNAQIGIGTPSVFTVDFWIQYIWAENQVIFDVGNTTDKVRLVVQNDEVYYNDYDPDVDAVPYNQEILSEGDVFVFNEPAAASSTIQHYGQGVTNPPAGHVFTLDGLGIKFEKNTWLHIGIVLTSDNMDVYLDTQKVEFPRYSKGVSDTEVILNGTQNTFVLDELMIDTTTAENFLDFAENTIKRIPWAALDRKNKQFVLEVDNLITNIFDSGSPFESRVKEIITEMKENGEL